MTRTDLTRVACSIARTVAVLPDGWAWLIVRDLAAGVCRFEALHTDLGISRKVLSQRLSDLERDGIVARTAYQENPPRFHYTLTEQGWDLLPVLVAMVAWGDRWRPTAEGPPVRFSHVGCPDSRVVMSCDSCDQRVSPDGLTTVPGPGGRAAPGTAVFGEYLLGSHGRPPRVCEGG